MLPLWMMPFREECSAWELRLLQFAEWLSTGILVAAPSVFFQEPPIPDSPQAALVQSALLLPVPRIWGCKWNFMFQPFKQPSPPGRQTPCCFSQLDVIWIPFQLSFCMLGSLAWGLDPTLLRGISLGSDIPPALQLPPMGAQPSFFWLLHTPYQSCCGEVVS